MVWLGAGVGLLVSALMLARGRDAWARVALVGVMLSQAAIVRWWTGAWRGTLANLIILVVIGWQVLMAARIHATSPSKVPLAQGKSPRDLAA